MRTNHAFNLLLALILLVFLAGCDPVVDGNTILRDGIILKSNTKGYWIAYAVTRFESIEAEFDLAGNVIINAHVETYSDNNMSKHILLACGYTQVSILPDEVYKKINLYLTSLQLPKF